ncbi:MAG: LPS-assembly protein LptD, partial [Thiobacillus sp.]
MSALPGFTLAALLLNASLAGANGLVLKKDLELKGSAVAGQEGPLFLTADRIDSTAVGIIEAAGRVEARQAGRNFFADWLRYDTRENSVQARGKVRLEQPTLLVTGDSLDIDLDTYSGQLDAPVYRFVGQPGRGDAERIDFIDENNFSLADATYTTCSADNEDWHLKIADLDIDRGRDVGTAHHASLRFLGVPILYTPWMSFPLGNARKSGVLAPTIGTTERSGLDVVVPYYLNLAPNYDATLYPRLLSKRGVQLGGEFRYLLEDAQGVNRVEYLNDSEAELTRWSVALNNSYRLNANTQAGMLFNRVSDDDYFRDLSNLISITSISHLNREVWLTTQHAHWNADLRAQSFQTLQDSTASTPIAGPYARLPHARLGAAQTFGRFEFTFESEATRFAHPTRTEGTRVLAYPTLRMPLANDYGFLTPQIGWHSSYYALDESAADDNIVRNLPIFSLDSGVVFDRPVRFSGIDFEQTLEPRVYYVYAPYRDQDDIPIFDTGQLDFRDAQMFTPNQFIGGDRI